MSSQEYGEKLKNAYRLCPKDVLASVLQQETKFLTGLMADAQLRRWQDWHIQRTNLRIQCLNDVIAG